MRNNHLGYTIDKYLERKIEFWREIMSIYNWIQKTIFNTYEEWHMKSPLTNSKGFHLIGIDNSLKAMQDGYMMYVEVTPPYAVKGCTSMKAVVGQSEELVNIYLQINGKQYVISDLSYSDAVKMMRLFVKKSILPEESTYTEVFGNDNEMVKDTFAKLSELLIENLEVSKKFLNRVKPETMEDIGSAWEELYEELLNTERAIELDWKVRKDIFVPAVTKLSVDLKLEINEDILDEDEDVPRWSKALNSCWEDYILAAMDAGSDSYVLMVLSKESFVQAKALARMILNRIAPAEEM